VGTSQAITVTGPCLYIVKDFKDYKNKGGLAKWQQERAGCTSRQFNLSLSPVEGCEPVEGDTILFVELPDGPNLSDRTINYMLDGLRAVAESLQYTAEELEDLELEFGDDMVERTAEIGGGCGYYFAAPDEDHWGAFIILPQTLWEQAVAGEYTPRPPKFKVKKQRDTTTSGDDDEEVAQPEETRRPATTATPPARPAPRPTGATPAAPSRAPAPTTPSARPAGKPATGGLRGALK